MHWIEIFLRASVCIVAYTFIGYPIFLSLMVLLKRFVRKKISAAIPFQPFVTIVIPCFNEADILEAKIANCKALDYPTEKLSLLFITDGSTDHSQEIINQHTGIQLLHDLHRKGKTAAVNRAMHFVTTPFVIFSDANSFLNSAAVSNIVKHFTDENTGCVAGEKRISINQSDTASAAGESMYWKYESVLKKLDSGFNSAVGAAGELAAFRTSLYTELPEDTLLDDFIQSIQIAAKGYKIVYEPGAFANEFASKNVEEELKRKIRIATGCWQAMKRLRGILHFTKTPLLFFQFFSHKVLRWAFVPFLLIFIFVLNIALLIPGGLFYKQIFSVQLIFYGLSVAGYFLRNKRIYVKTFFIPYYFCVMHYALLAGLHRYLNHKQEGAWEKAQRSIQ
jgi:cellulose synthase/poly-beta-1,6-N-acetylglucosamine synthase-like glycosyltransferase